VLAQAGKLGLSVATVTEGLDLRVDDMAEARRLRAEIKAFLSSREAA
jgi:hypothetical protein